MNVNSDTEYKASLRKMGEAESELEDYHGNVENTKALMNEILSFLSKDQLPDAADV